MILKLFLIFFKIGAFTIGGAYAMIPLIRRELVEKQNWIDDEDFLDALAAAQSAPGPIAVNLSVYIGYKLKKLPGLLICTLGTVLPSFVVILGIAIFFGVVSDLEVTRRIFAGLKPAVVALIVVPVVQMSRKAGLSLYNFWFPAVVAVMVALMGVSPIYLILLTIVYAVIKSIFRMRKYMKEME
jgi:chromate transporter